MQIPPEQGQFMAMLVKMMDVKKALELGVFTGYSSTVVAMALPEDGLLVGCDRNTEWTKMAKDVWEKTGVAHKIDLKTGDALDTLESLLAQGEAGTFDFAFIDADKKCYLEYYELTLQLLRQGGLMVIDNMFRLGQVVDESVNDMGIQTIRALTKKMHDDDRVEISMVPIGDGVMLARKC